LAWNVLSSGKIYRQVPHLSNSYSQEQLQTWCLEQAARMKYSREHRIKTQLSARDNVEACMRMLAIFSKRDADADADDDFTSAF
jgi:hypothetical protein